jgi:hypothetical protein
MKHAATNTITPPISPTNSHSNLASLVAQSQALPPPTYGDTALVNMIASNNSSHPRLNIFDTSNQTGIADFYPGSKFVFLNLFGVSWME